MAVLNWDPLSVVIVAGTPKVATHPWAKASATVSVVMSGIGIACGHLESLSTIVRRYL